MAPERVEINHRHEEGIFKKWLWWINAVLMLASAVATIYSTKLIFSTDLFELSLGDAIGRMLWPLITFGCWVMFAHIVSLNSNKLLIWIASLILGLSALFVLEPMFSFVAFPAVVLANASLMFVARKEYHERLKVSPYMNVGRSIHTFLNILFLALSIGVFMIYGSSLSKEGLQIPESLMKGIIEQSFAFAGAPVKLESEMTFSEVIKKVSDQITLPQIKEQLEAQGYSGEDIDKYIEEKSVEFLAQTEDQFFGKLGIVGEKDKKFFVVVQDSISNAIQEGLPFSLELTLPLILAAALFILLHSFAFIFVSVGQIFAEIWFKILFWTKLIKIDKRDEKVECVRF